MLTADEGFAGLLRLIADHSSIDGFSEADTRCKIIDRLLLEVLGWPEYSFKREVHSESGYADYHLSVNDSVHLIVEAKREGEYFDLPESYSSRYYQIDGAIASVKPFQAAITQSRAYADESGCKYAMVTNGRQFGLFTAITVGTNWKKGKALIFRSLEDVKDNFSLFWNILAYENVTKGSLFKHLEEQVLDVNYLKTINEMRELNSSFTRNHLYTYLRPLSELIFSELLEDRHSDVLNQCYVYGRSNNTLYRDIGDYFVDKVPHHLSTMNVRDVTENDRKSGIFQDAFERLSKAGRDQIILLLGGIGAGKSTFLHRFFRVVLSKNDNLIYFHIDFRRSPPEIAQTESFILEQVSEIWQKNYAAKYYDLFREAGLSLDFDSNKEKIKQTFALLRAHKTIVLVIDNVDQHVKEYQENLFLESCYLSEYWKILTIVSLREETFLSSSRKGIFDAYDIPKFHVASPNFLAMIKKRLEYAISFVSNLPASADGKIPPKIRSELIKYFKVIHASLQKENRQSKMLIELVDSITVGNMREGLEFFNNFLVSGNTNIEEIFSIVNSTGKYQISFHQFMKSIMLGEYRYYQQDISKIMNVFDFDQTLGSSPFWSFRILRFLSENMNRKSEIGRGFVRLNDIFHELGKLSVAKPFVADCLLKMIEYGLIELDTQSRKTLETAHFCKVTHSGRYYQSALIFELVYLNHVVIDTPISDRELVFKMRETIDDKGFATIVDRVGLFTKYLIDQEETEFRRFPEYLSNDIGRHRIVPELRSKTVAFLTARRP